MLGSRLSRRDVLRRALALGLSTPAVAGLLAACGGSSKATATKPAATATAATGASSPTSAATATTAAATPTTGASPSAASSPSAGSASPTSGASPTAAGSGKVSGGDPLMGKTIEPATHEGGTFIEGGTSDLRSLQPVLWNDVPSGNFGALIFEALIEPNPDNLEPVGNLATGWEISGDALNWTLYLRDGVTWHDGKPFTAQDVKTTYDLFMNPDAGGNQTSNLVAKVASVNVVDDATVQFVAKLPNADFLLDICSLAVFADHIWAGVDAKSVGQDAGATGQDPKRVVGTGPFIFKEWVTADHATVTPNENYWGGKPHLDQYIYKVVSDEGAGMQQLKTGDIDYYQFVPAAQVSDLQTASNVKIYNYKQLNFTFYGYQLDTAHSTKFQDPNVRKALLYALDRKSYVDNIYFGFAEVAVGTMPPLSWAYNPDGIKEKYEFDVDKANQLLDDAGWAKGPDGIRAKDGQKLQFTAYTASGFDVFVKLLQAYQEAWKAIGVDMTPVDEPFQQLVDRITSSFDFEMFLIGFNWNVPPDQSAMWACNSYKAGFNIVKYCNPQVDDLLNQALVEQDKQKRIQLYTDFQNVLLEDLPMVATEFGVGIDAVNTRVHNIFPNYANTRFNLETWWVDA
jgi:peptide/nickel transport system substrate-binding protein